MTKKQTPPIVKISYFTAFTVVCWIGFEVYRALTIEPPPIVSEAVLAPVNPQLDSQALDRLQKRVYLDPSQIGVISVVTPGEELAATPTPEPVATEEAEVSESTEEGEVNE